MTSSNNSLLFLLVSLSLILGKYFRDNVSRWFVIPAWIGYAKASNSSINCSRLKVTLSAYCANC